MRYNDLKIVNKYDKDRNLLGTYNYIFIQDGCVNINDNFAFTVNIADRFYKSMLDDFAIYDERVLANYKSGSVNGSTVYHVSYGQMGEDSLSVFFRIYAVQVVAGAIIQVPGDELYSIVHINTGMRGTVVKLRRGSEEISDIVVNESTGIFSFGGQSYHAIMEIVGVGSHRSSYRGGNSYRLAARNENLIEDRDLFL